MPTRPNKLALLAVGVLTFHASVLGRVEAQPPAASAEEARRSAQDAEARALYGAAELAFEAGRYEEALRHFQRAYELSGRAGLLYNIGQCADRLRYDRLALESFEQYLQEVPESPHRYALEARVQILRAAVERDESRTPVQAARTTEVAPTPSSESVGAGPPAEDSSLGSNTGIRAVLEPAVEAAGTSTALAPGVPTMAGSSEATDREPQVTGRAATIALATAAGGCAITGVTLMAVGYRSIARIESIPDGTRFDSFRDDYDSAPRQIGAAYGLFGVSAALSVVALVVRSPDDAEPTLAFTVHRHGISLAGTF